MALMTYADLMAPAPSDRKKRVVDVALARMKNAASPMPPSGVPEVDEVTAVADWVKAGAPQTACKAARLWDGGSTSGPECTTKGDCPGTLTCVHGACVGQPGPSPSTADAGATAAVWGSFESSDSWSVFKVAALGPASTYTGAAFDGRYVYFAPDGTSGTVLRHDTQGAFDSLAAWSTYVLTNRDATAAGYRGAVFDGRYVYLVPSAATALLARFDTHGSMGDDAAWSILDLHTVGASGGFQGATFDGRYLHFVPSGSVTLKYDTHGSLTDAASWSRFNLTTLNAQATGYSGAVFDGRYTYYVPTAHGIVPHGTVTRYDTQGDFTKAASWGSFDLATANPKAVGYKSGGFDGRFLYLVPGWTAPTSPWSQSTVARFDTQQSFTTAASWEFFDTQELFTAASGFNTATFDGRFLVLTPGYDATQAAYHGLMLRFDTTSPLALSSSWSFSDTTQLSPLLTNLRGAAFDGQYMYFAPRAGMALRLLSRTPAKAAAFPMVGGSFY
jgi:hypothetical protein